MNTKNVAPPRTLRIEIWKKDNMEWSLEGDGSQLQYQQAGMKIRSRTWNEHATTRNLPLFFFLWGEMTRLLRRGDVSR